MRNRDSRRSSWFEHSVLPQWVVRMRQVRGCVPAGGGDADNHWLTVTTTGCHSGRVKEVTEAQREVFDHLNQIRAQAVEHARQARRLSAQRRAVIEKLLGDGFSQADIAREMGVTRQAVQKMIAAG
jgi:DNA-directed RNA polymerase specialized sigma24 family protein